MRPGCATMAAEVDGAAAPEAARVEPYSAPDGVLADLRSAEQEDADAPTARSQGELIVEARVKGYEGEACGECGNFTLVRNGTCLKCDTCGATTGCS